MPLLKSSSEKAGGVRPRAFDGYRMPAIGDRVTVKAGKAHDKMTADAVGTIVIIDGTALGVLFDGMKNVHKWYVADELNLVEDKARSQNIGTEIKAGRPRAQADAIGYSVQRQAEKRKKQGDEMAALGIKRR